MARPRTTAPTTPKVLAKALDVLDLFDPQRPEWSEGEIATALGLPRSTAHRLIRALEARGLLARSVGARYRLGVGALTLGRRAAATLDVRRVLRPVLETLATATGETAVLSVLAPNGDGVACVDRIESSERLRLSLEIGAVVPLHAGATSRALLAFLGDEAIDAVLAAPLGRLAPGTIVDPAALRTALAAVRALGYATSHQETNAGAWGVGAPVLDRDCRPLAVVAAIAPAQRHSAPHEAEVRAAVLAASRGAALALGAAS